MRPITEIIYEKRLQTETALSGEVKMRNRLVQKFGAKLPIETCTGLHFQPKKAALEFGIMNGKASLVSEIP